MKGFGVLALGDLARRTAGSPASGDRGVGEPEAACPPAELAALIEETVALFRRLRGVGAEVYGESSLSGAHRNVLKELEREGVRTVPEMARARGVSRQHVQAHVNDLARQGYVELLENPAHKRSRRVRLTGAGRRFLAEMANRERRLLSSLAVAAGAGEIEGAIRTLRVVREAFERRASDGSAIEGGLEAAGEVR
jgi:DNA-binding MarR family transcriptional regulator